MRRIKIWIRSKSELTLRCHLFIYYLYGILYFASLFDDEVLLNFEYVTLLTRSF